MATYAFDADDEGETDRLGAALAASLLPGTVVALDGTLGAGKTRLVRAIAAGFGIASEEVTSPTFVLCHEYHGTQDLLHLDAYRLRDEDELRELGIEEMFESPAIILIEWAERVAEALPAGHLRIEIEVTGRSSRRFTITAVGERLRATVQRVGANLSR